MSTKVHDDDDDETFDEVDVILESAKVGLQMKRSLERKSRRHINLSDIPENFAHVPAPGKIKSEFCRPWTPPPAPRKPAQVAEKASPLHCKARTSSLIRTTRTWVRDRLMACVTAVESRTNCGMCGHRFGTSVHVPSRKPRTRS